MTNLNDIETQIHYFSGRIEERFKALNARLDRIEKKLAEPAHITGMDQKSIDEQTSAFAKKWRDLQNSPEAKAFSALNSPKNT